MRNHLIGGTDAASLIGLGRLSPTALYLRLRGEIPDTFEGNEATDAGLLFEDHVAVPMAASRLGMRLVRPAERTIALPDDPRIGASLDFETADGELADIKLTGDRSKWGQLGERVPLGVAAQMQFQMAVARARGRAVPCVHVIAMFVPGFVMEDFPIAEDREVGSALLGKARQMLEAVDRGEPPIAGSEADARALFLGVRGKVCHADSELRGMLVAMRDIRAQRDAADAHLQALRDKVLPMLRDATEVVDPDTGEVLATYRNNRVFDDAAAKDRHPMEYAAATTKLDRKALEGLIGKRKMDALMREPASAAEATRVFKLKGE